MCSPAPTPPPRRAAPALTPLPSFTEGHYPISWKLTFSCLTRYMHSTNAEGRKGQVPKCLLHPPVTLGHPDPVPCATVPVVHVEKLHWAAQTPLQQDPLLPRDLTPVSSHDLPQSHWPCPGTQAVAPLNHGEDTTIRSCLVMRKKGHE